MTRRNVGTLLNGIGVLVTKNMEKFKVLKAAFDLVLTVLSLSFRNPRPLRPMGKSGGRKTYPWQRIRLGNI